MCIRPSHPPGTLLVNRVLGSVGDIGGRASTFVGSTLKSRTRTYTCNMQMHSHTAMDAQTTAQGAGIRTEGDDLHAVGEVLQTLGAHVKRPVCTGER
jgi:hypothetical protein